MSAASEELVDTAERLAELCRRLEGAEWVALDTEADSLHSYPERLCLVQVGFEGEGEVLVDGLAGLDLSPLARALLGTGVVLHGGDFDLRLLGRALGVVPGRVFDTMIAARLLGDRRFALSDLVAARLGVELEKGLQKANWARRPLTARMADYAREDVRHLLALRRALGAELAGLGRLEWLEQSCARLVAECSEPRSADEERFRLKGSDRLDRRGLAVLRALHGFREREAVELARPPYFVVSHEELVRLAREATEVAVPRLRLPRLPSDRKARLLEALRRGLAEPESAWPERASRRRRPEPVDEGRVRTLAAVRDGRAAELGIDPTVIASRAVLNRLARSPEQAAAALLPWQRELLGL